MRTFNLIFATFTLMIACGANAATVANFSVSHYSFLAPAFTTDGTGNATLEDTGQLTLNLIDKIFNDGFHLGTLYRTILWSGSWDGTTFTPVTGLFTITACSSGFPPFCPAPVPSKPTPLDPSTTTTGSITANGGIIVESFASSPVLHTYALTPAAVPLPASAWLLGSGIFGLFATRRKSKTI
jgi:hypothetical protein